MSKSSRRLWVIATHSRTGTASAAFIGLWCGLGCVLGRFAPNFHHRHVAGFWLAPRWQGVWSFVLLVAIAFWCIHSALRLREAFKNRKGRARGSAGKELGLALARVLGVAALGAYAWFVIAAPAEEFIVTAQGIAIHGEQYRALRVEPRTPELRSWQSPAAWLERRVGTHVEKMRVERGRWWPSGVGSYELAMARARMSADGAVFRHGGERVTLKEDRETKQGFLTYFLRAIHRRRHRTANEVQGAEVVIGGQKHVLPLDPEWAGQDAFLGMKESPVILLRVHKKLTLELSILAAVLLITAVVSARVEAGVVRRAGR